MGDKCEIFRKKNCAYGGRLAPLFTDDIDRGFMRKFQVSGELHERFDRVE